MSTEPVRAIVTPTTASAGITLHNSPLPLITCVLFLSFLIAPLAANAQYTYADNGDGTVTITSYTGPDTVVQIPAALDGHPVSAIGDSAFSSSPVTSVTIPNNITGIGASAFLGCTQLMSIDLPNSLTSLGSSAFDFCTSLHEITIPGGIASVPLYAFRRCSDLTKVTLSEGVKSVGFQGFAGCSSLMEVVFPSTLTTIESGGFSSCGFTNLVISDTVTDIQGNAFDSCAALTNFTWSAGVGTINFGVFQGCSKLAKIAIPDNVTNVQENAFASCTALTNVFIGASLSSISPLAFFSSPNLASFDVSPQNSAFNALDGLLVSKDQTRLVLAPSALGGTYKVPENILVIDTNAFFSLKAITNVIFPHALSRIGPGAFSRVGLIGSLIIPDTVTNIGAGAFSICSGLTSVEIGNGVTEVGRGAFQSCANITNVSLGTNVLSIGDSAFSGTKISSVTIPDSASTIDVRAFLLCPNLAEVVIGKGLKEIGARAFEGCSNLDGVTLGTNVTTIGGSAFKGCASLTNMRFPATLASIGQSAFEGCTNITALYFKGDAPAAAGSMITYLDPLAIIYYNAGTTGWESTLEGYFTQMWDEPLQLLLTKTASGLAVKKYFGTADAYKLPASINGVPVTSIGALAFATSRLTSLTCAGPLESIGDLAFYACTNLTALYFTGNAPVLGSSAFFVVSGVVYHSVGATGWGQFFGGLPALAYDYGSQCVVDLSNGALTVLKYNGSEIAVHIPGTVNGFPVTAIAPNAFVSSSLVQVVIESGVTNIGDYAFAGCANLNEVYFLGNAPTTAPTAFADLLATAYYLPNTSGWSPIIQTRDGKFGVRNGTFGFNVLGTSRLGVSVKARDSLGSGSWTQVGAATLDQTGTFYFSDAATKDYTRRFYTVSAVSFAGLPLYPWSN